MKHISVPRDKLGELQATRSIAEKCCFLLTAAGVEDAKPENLAIHVAALLHSLEAYRREMIALRRQIE